jgi:hypothetical protein
LKILTIGAIALVLLASSIVGYSMWSDALHINSQVNTGDVGIGFIASTLIYSDSCGSPPGYGYNGGYDWNATGFPDRNHFIQLDKDVACTEAELVGTPNDGYYPELNVTIHNAYPWYYTHIAFKVCNSGTIPVKIWRILLNGTYYYEINAPEVRHGVYMDLNGDGVNDVVVWWGDNFGAQLEPGDCADISFDIVVLQGAPQGQDLSFTVQLEAVQWNEYSVPS